MDEKDIIIEKLESLVDKQKELIKNYKDTISMKNQIIDILNERNNKYDSYVTKLLNIIDELKWGDITNDNNQEVEVGL